LIVFIYDDMDDYVCDGYFSLMRIVEF